MSSLLKRELLVWFVAAVVITGYIVLGQWLAPVVPPDPDPSDAEGIKITSLQDVLKEVKRKRRQREIELDRQRFLLQWYQWGAGVGLLLVFAYTWWRPPWHTPGEQDAGLQTPGFWDRSPISPKALLMLLTTVALAAILIVLLVVGFG